MIKSGMEKYKTLNLDMRRRQSFQAVILSITHTQSKSERASGFIAHEKRKIKQQNNEPISMAVLT